MGRSSAARASSFGKPHHVATPATSASLLASSSTSHDQQERTTRAAQHAAAAEREERQQAALALVQHRSQEFKLLPYETSWRLSKLMARGAPTAILFRQRIGSHPSCNVFLELDDPFSCCSSSAVQTGGGLGVQGGGAGD